LSPLLHCSILSPSSPVQSRQGQSLPLQIFDNLLRDYDLNITSRLHTDPKTYGRAVRNENGTYLLEIKSNQARGKRGGEGETKPLEEKTGPAFYFSIIVSLSVHVSLGTHTRVLSLILLPSQVGQHLLEIFVGGVQVYSSMIRLVRAILAVHLPSISPVARDIHFLHIQLPRFALSPYRITASTVPCRCDDPLNGSAH
jgi:hypothetical protein